MDEEGLCFGFDFDLLVLDGDLRGDSRIATLVVVSGV